MADRVATAAAVSLAGTLVVLAGLKVPQLLAPHAGHAPGLVGLLRHPLTLAAAVAIEAGLGVTLVTRLRALALHGVHAWIAILGGVQIAVVVLGLPAASCGCLGSGDAGFAARLGILCGMGVLAYLADGGRRTPGPAPGAGPAGGAAAS